jgi:hypothetical protein
VDGETDPQVDGTTKHGTACAEIIHDIAPAATLYLAKISTNLDLQEAVAWLKDTHQVDIISTSMGWYNLTPGDGTGEFADLVQAARDAGILWVTAASNDREAHWGGLYYDPNNTGYHFYNATQNVNYFGPGDGNAYAIPAGNRVTVFLRWNDWSSVNQDYDLYLLRWNGSAWDHHRARRELPERWRWPDAHRIRHGRHQRQRHPYGFAISASTATGPSTSRCLRPRWRVWTNSCTPAAWPTWPMRRAR